MKTWISKLQFNLKVMASMWLQYGIWAISEMMTLAIWNVQPRQVVFFVHMTAISFSWRLKELNTRVLCLVSKILITSVHG